MTHLYDINFSELVKAMSKHPPYADYAARSGLQAIFINETMKHTYWSNRVRQHLKIKSTDETDLINKIVELLPDFGMKL